jgi:hypothetical protein
MLTQDNSAGIIEVLERFRIRAAHEGGEFTADAITALAINAE